MKRGQVKSVRIILVGCFMFASSVIGAATQTQQPQENGTAGLLPRSGAQQQLVDASGSARRWVAEQPKQQRQQAPQPAPTRSAPPAVVPPLIADGDDAAATLVVDTNLVTVAVTVTDKDGRHIDGLKKDAFTVYDEGRRQEITFFSDADAPASISIVLDTSESMSGDKFGRAREALARFIETSHSGDEYSLISFSERVRLLLDLTHDGDAVLDKFKNVEPKGETALYDAAYLGVEKAGRGTHAKRAILVISDGIDNCSRYTFEELRRLLQESDVVFYAGGILGSPGAESRAGRRTLQELASVSGGKAFFPWDASEMYEAFERIALELRNQYEVGFRPTHLLLPCDNQWHRVKVSVSEPGQQRSRRLHVRSREGYYAFAKPR